MKLRHIKLIGTLAFYVSLPGLYYYLQRQERTRVVIAVGDEVLVLKAWYGSNRWMLPGGGVHRGEDITIAALREVTEETGIKLESEQLTHLRTTKLWDTYGIRFMCHSFYVQLAQKPEISTQNLEICHALWRPAAEVAADRRGTLRVTRTAVAAWIQHRNLL